MKSTDTNFWQKLPSAFSALAPMDDVTDAVFRQIIVKTGKPDVLFTEFTNCDGLASRGRKVVIRRFKYETNEHPIVAQIWGSTPKNFFTSAKIAAELGFDGIDINMGCPVKDITQKGACSALISNPTLAAEIIQATKEGSDGLPVSVKTRVGRSTPVIEEWIGFLLEQNLAALTVHLRTAAEMSKVPAHWEYMSQIAELRKTIAPETILIGNGDVQSISEGKEKTEQFGLDGIMYGRAIFTNPWLFTSIDPSTKSLKERLLLFLEHILLFQQTWGSTKNFAILKKYCKIYIHGIEDGATIRQQIMLANDIESMKKIVSEYLKNI